MDGDAAPAREDLAGLTQGRRLLIGACGAANILNLPAYVHALQDSGRNEVRVVMTAAAASIIPASSVRLVCDVVFSDGPDRFDPGHVRIARWAEQLVVLPATAHMLGQVANGLAGNLLASVALAFGKSIVFFPSMNELMWKNSVVQRNAGRLREDGHHVIDPQPVRSWEIASGALAIRLGIPSPQEAACIVHRLAPQRDLRGP